MNRAYGFIPLFASFGRMAERMIHAARDAFERKNVAQGTINDMLNDVDLPPLVGPAYCFRMLSCLIL